jgi:hypothetical protein
MRTEPSKEPDTRNRPSGEISTEMTSLLSLNMVGMAAMAVQRGARVSMGSKARQEARVSMGTERETGTNDGGTAASHLWQWDEGHGIERADVEGE